MFKRLLPIFISTFIISSPSITYAHNKAKLNILTTITPIYFLTKGVSGDLNNLDLLVSGKISPHDYQPKPSDIEKIKKSDLVIRIDQYFQPRFTKILNANSIEQKIFSLTNIKGLNLLPNEDHLANKHNGEGHDESHETEEHKDHEEHEEHKADMHHNEKHHDEKHHDEKHHDEKHHDEKHHDEKHHDEKHHDEKHHDEDKKHHDEKHHDEDEKHHDEKHHDEDEKHEDAHHGHSHSLSNFDLHIWLSPKNAIKITNAIAAKLSALDPHNAKTYANNAKKQNIRLNLLNQTAQQKLKTFKQASFFSHHDAFGYFTQTFGLKRSYPLIQSLNHQLSANKLQKIINLAKTDTVNCIMLEPQLNDKIAKTIQKTKSDIKINTWDPLGFTLPLEASSYDILINNMVEQLTQCLKE